MRLLVVINKSVGYDLSNVYIYARIREVSRKLWPAAKEPAARQTVHCVWPLLCLPTETPRQAFKVQL